MSKGQIRQSKPGIDAAAIRELAELLNETGLTEIEIEHNGARIRVSRARGGVAGRCAGARAPPAAAPAAPAALPAARTRRGALAHGRHRLSVAGAGQAGLHQRRPDGEGRRHAVHRRSDEDHEPDHRAQRRQGKEISVNDGQPVEFGQTLCVID